MWSLRIDDIPQEGLELREEKKPCFFGLEDDKFISYAGPISISLMVEKVEDKVKVKGEADFEARLICMRCLESFSQKIRSPLDIIYEPEPSSVMREEESLSEKETDTFSYGKDGIIGLRDAVREYIILSLPVKSLCLPDCLGLCPSCGKNLNQGPCSCRTQRLDSRFAKLKTVKQAFLRKESKEKR